MHQNVSYSAGTRAQREQQLLAEDIPPEPIFLFGSVSPPLLDHQSGPTRTETPFNLIGIDAHIPMRGGHDIAQLSLVANPGITALSPFYTKNDCIFLTIKQEVRPDGMAM